MVDIFLYYYNKMNDLSSIMHSSKHTVLAKQYEYIQRCVNPNITKNTLLLAYLSHFTEVHFYQLPAIIRNNFT